MTTTKKKAKDPTWVENMRRLTFQDAAIHLKNYLRPRRRQHQRKTDLRQAASLLLDIARSL